jgi:hypothetical protein
MSHLIFKDAQGTALSEYTNPYVRVVAYGFGARAEDCGRLGRIIRFNRTRAVVTFHDGTRRSIAPTCLLAVGVAEYVGAEEA